MQNGYNSSACSEIQLQFLSGAFFMLRDLVFSFLLCLNPSHTQERCLQPNGHNCGHNISVPYYGTSLTKTTLYIIFNWDANVLSLDTVSMLLWKCCSPSTKYPNVIYSSSVRISMASAYFIMPQSKENTVVPGEQKVQNLHLICRNTVYWMWKWCYWNPQLIFLWICENWLLCPIFLVVVGLVWAVFHLQGV